jgi:hypothetical protein
VIYVLTNEQSAWITDLKEALQRDGWTVATTRDLVLDTEQRDVSMAVDMEIARRAAVFLGNGVSLDPVSYFFSPLIPVVFDDEQYSIPAPHR